MSQNIEQKTINNAISAYLLIFISGLLLLNKDNKYINNDFVKNHVKASIIIHIWFAINYIIFITNSLWYQINIFWYWLNLIIANIIFIFLLWLTLVWIYKSYKWELFDIWNFIKTNKNIKLEIKNENNYNEKDKLSIILSYIPFIWYVVGSKFENDSIKNILKINLFITVIIYLIHLLWYWNLTSLFVLSYTILVIFIWINLFARDELISFNLPYYFLPEGKIILQKTIIRYISNYFKWNFKEFGNIKEEIIDEKISRKENDKSEINNLELLKLNKNLIYIPIINLIFIKEINSNYKIHVKTWITITIIFILLFILKLLWIVNSSILLLILFPICFWLWKINNKTYRMPYIYELVELFENIYKKISKTKKDIKEKHNEEKNLNLKVK